MNDSEATCLGSSEKIWFYSFTNHWLLKVCSLLNILPSALGLLFKDHAMYASVLS